MINRIIYSLVLSVFVLNLSAQQVSGPIISFDKSYHDFESLVQGEVVDIVFEFINVGDRPVVIENVLTSCGCTASHWDKTPIEPETKGIIKVTFDSTGKIGQQRKVITVVSNAVTNRTELIIEAFVLPKRSQL